mgnify:CR=1 FL=1
MLIGSSFYLVQIGGSELDAFATLARLSKQCGQSEPHDSRYNNQPVVAVYHFLETHYIHNGYIYDCTGMALTVFADSHDTLVESK